MNPISQKSCKKLYELLVRLTCEHPEHTQSEQHAQVGRQARERFEDGDKEKRAQADEEDELPTWCHLLLGHDERLPRLLLLQSVTVKET
jgi:hypothetical protein